MTDLKQTTSSRLARVAAAAKRICASEQPVKTGRSAETQTTQLSATRPKNSIITDYNWPGKYKPFAHQKQTAEFLTLNRKAFCFNEQGTGKTASVIWATDYLMKLGVIKRVLVICPLSIMKSAWQADLFTFAMHRTCDVAYGDSKARRKIINQGAEFVIINFDGVEIVKKDIIDKKVRLICIYKTNTYQVIIHSKVYSRLKIKLIMFGKKYGIMENSYDDLDNILDQYIFCLVFRYSYMDSGNQQLAIHQSIKDIYKKCGVNFELFGSAINTVSTQSC
jgi:hypothetical protein